MLYQITSHWFLDEEMLEWRFTTASGPGGQHVNRSQTAVTVMFSAGQHLSADWLARLRNLAGSRLDENGVLTVQCQKHRSQLRNRTDAVESLVELLRQSSRPPRKRKATKPTRGSKERRLDAKKQRSKVKADRRKKNWD